MPSTRCFSSCLIWICATCSAVSPTCTVVVAAETFRTISGTRNACPGLQQSSESLCFEARSCDGELKRTRGEIAKSKLPVVTGGRHLLSVRLIRARQPYLGSHGDRATLVKHGAKDAANQVESQSVPRTRLALERFAASGWHFLGANLVAAGRELRLPTTTYTTAPNLREPSLCPWDPLHACKIDLTFLPAP